jgi:uncharacterized membrane protein YfcA
MLEWFDLSLIQVTSLVVLVFLAGFVDSIAGGGGLISLPAYFAVGLPAHTALATNKFSSFSGTLTSVIRYWRAGKIRVRVGLLATTGALAGSALGARLALWASEGVVETVMLVLVPVVLIVFSFKDRLFPAPKHAATVQHEGPKAVAIGAVVGLYDGFFGPGTGAFLAIGFYTFLRFDLLTASANARLANLASNFGALAVFLVSGQVRFPLAFLTAAAGIAGNLIGSRLAIKKGERIIRPLLIVVLVLLLAEVVRQRFA